MLLSGLLGVLGVYLLRCLVQAEPVGEKARWRVRAGPAMRLFALFTLPLAGFVTYAALHAANDQRPWAAGVTAFFWVAAGILIYTAFFVSITYDEAGLTYQSPLAGKRRFAWDRLRGGGYSAFLGSYFLVFDRNKVWISELMDGGEALIAFAGEKFETGR